MYGAAAETPEADGGSTIVIIVMSLRRFIDPVDVKEQASFSEQYWKHLNADPQTSSLSDAKRRRRSIHAARDDRTVELIQDKTEQLRQDEAQDANIMRMKANDAQLVNSGG